MNAHQQANHALDILLGPTAKAVWLAVRVDDCSLARVAREHDKSVPWVRDIVLGWDALLDVADLAPRQQSTGVYHPCYEGFHQIGDGE